MNPLFVVWLLVLECVSTLMALIGAPIVCAFAKWDDETTTFTGGAPNNGPATIRGDLPSWASWWGTFDERLPGGMYEPTVVRWHTKYGRYVCSVLWLWRNRMFGMSKALHGKPPAGRYKNYKWYRCLIWIGVGYKQYRATPQAHWVYGPFVEVPSVTFRLSRG